MNGRITRRGFIGGAAAAAALLRAPRIGAAPSEAPAIFPSIFPVRLRPGPFDAAEVNRRFLISILTAALMFR
jgi:hypothetical protein